MKTLLVSLTVLAALCLLPPADAHALDVNQPAPDFTLLDLDGQEQTLSDFRGDYVVLEWTNYECPFVKKHYNSGNMQGLQKSLTSKGVAWLSINSSAPGKQGNFSAEEVSRRMAAFGASPTAYLRDPNGDVGRLYGAQTTPHIFLIDPNGILIYQGAIDSIASFDEADIAKAVNYLEQAYLEAISGKEISVPQTKSYGCSVKY